MAKKKNPSTKQMGFRIPTDLAGRLEKCADMLALDLSALLRLVIVESLPVFEADLDLPHLSAAAISIAAKEETQ